ELPIGAEAHRRLFFFSSRRRHTRWPRDWSSDVCSSDLSKSREMDVLADAATPEQIARKAQELGCRSVAFTYNDPTVFLEYAVDEIGRASCRERAEVGAAARWLRVKRYVSRPARSPRRKA